MKIRLLTVLGLLVLPVLPAAGAGPSASAQAEIAYLLNHVETSGCEFYRNGSWHDANSAAKHLHAKYDYLASRDRISTAEDFIEKAGTESSLSGRPYEVRCSDGNVVTSNQWLRDALARYRACSADVQCASRDPRDAPGVDELPASPELSRPP